MSDPSITYVATVLAAGLGGCLLIARMFDKALPKSEPALVCEDSDDLGYFLDGPQGSGTPVRAIRGVDDALPVCPDVIPDWMLEESRGRSR